MAGSRNVSAKTRWRRLGASALGGALVASCLTTAAYAVTAPSVPIGVTAAIPQQSAIAVTFVGSWDDGGSPITAYDADCLSNDAGVHVSISGLGTPASDGSYFRTLVLHGATNGDHYRCTVNASNSTATSANSAASNQVVPGAVLPGVSSLGMSLGATSVAINLELDGAGPITGFGASCASGDGGVLRRASAAVGSNGDSAVVQVTGLTAGKTYSCSARALAVTPTAPYAVVGSFIAGRPGYGLGSVTFGADTVTAGNGRATVNVRTANFTGVTGLPTTGYRADCASTDGGVEGVATGGTSGVVTVTGLTNGKTYSCVSSAENANGFGTPATASTGTIMAGRPARPVLSHDSNLNPEVSTSSGLLAIHLTSLGASDPSAPILSANAFCVSSDGVASGAGSVSNPSGPFEIDVSGLANGKTFACTVTQSNAAGPGPATLVPGVVSGPPDPFNPLGGFVVGRPGQASGVSASPQSGALSVGGTAPADNGGSAITGYTATCISPEGGARGSASGSALPLVVSGLTNGKLYACRVVVSSAAGAGAASGASKPSIPGEPTAPTITKVTPTTGALHVTFAAPGQTGGGTITGYSASCTSAAGATFGPVTGSASPLVVTGLANGQPYSCVLFATTSGGAGLTGLWSGTPGTVPGAPAIAMVTPGNARLTVAVTQPSNLGGLVVTGDSVTCASSNGGVAKTVTQSSLLPIAVTGVTNGKTYTCKVKAINAAGAGPTSAASHAMKAGLPSAPRGVAAGPGNGAMSVSFLAPTSDGGFTVTGYSASCASSNGGVTRSKTGTKSPLLVTTLTNFKTYTCSVVATNSHGTGVAGVSAAAKPGLPSAPRSVAGVPGSGSASVSFLGASSNGGFPITSYKASCASSNGGAAASKTGTKSPLVVTGLTNTKSYVCSVAAANSHGAGLSASSAAVKPGLATAPQGLTVSPGDGSITLGFAAPLHNGGSTISGYSATCTSIDGGVTGSQTGPGPTLVVSGLTDNRVYACAVSATNGNGAGVAVGTPAVLPFA